MYLFTESELSLLAANSFTVVES